MPRSATSRQQDIARRALQAAGLKADGPLGHAMSTSNDVFQAEDHVVRVNRGGSDRLLREAILCQALPQLEWTPEVVEYGRIDDASFLIIRRKKGSTLARWWPDMRPSQRQDAIRQLAGCLRAIHSTPVPDDLEPLRDIPQILGSPQNPVLPLLHGIQRLRSIATVDPGLIDDLETKARSLTPALEHFTDNRLIHGDLTFENVLWNGSSISAVLDFEWSRGAPRDLDLDVLCRFLAIPELHLPPGQRSIATADDYTDVPAWLAEVYPELFSQGRLRERLALFGMAFEVRAVLRNPPSGPVDRLPPLHPYLRLMDVAANGGPGARLVKPVVSRGRLY